MKAAQSVRPPIFEQGKCSNCLGTVPESCSVVIACHSEYLPPWKDLANDMTFSRREPNADPPVSDTTRFVSAALFLGAVFLEDHVTPGASRPEPVSNLCAIGLGF